MSSLNQRSLATFNDNFYELTTLFKQDGVFSRTGWVVYLEVNLTNRMWFSVVYSLFYDNCRNSRALIDQFLLSICGQTHEFEIYPTRQRARAGNSTICYRKKQIDASFYCACPVIDNEFGHNIVKVVCGSTDPRLL